MGRTAKGYKGVGMEGPIARWYATATAKDDHRHQDQARMAIARAPRGAAVLEIAPGPGYTSIALARTGDYTVTGLDISSTFVEIARRNAADAGVPADFRLGNAATMPFRTGSFDFVLCCAAFKNFAEPVLALREMYRVLRPRAGADHRPAPGRDPAGRGRGRGQDGPEHGQQRHDQVHARFGAAAPRLHRGAVRPVRGAHRLPVVRGRGTAAVAGDRPVQVAGVRAPPPSRSRRLGHESMNCPSGRASESGYLRP